jgi:hypothetical protein
MFLNFRYKIFVIDCLLNRVFTFFLLAQKESNKEKGHFCPIAPRDKRGYTLWSQFAYRRHGAGYFAALHKGAIMG